MAKLHRDPRLSVVVNKVHNPRPGSLLLVIPHPRTARSDTRLRRDACHLRAHHRGAAHRPRSKMYEMEVVRNALLRHVGGHGRNDHAILERQLTNCNGSKHRWQRFADAVAPRKPSLHRFHVALVTKLEIGMAQPLASGQQALSELLRL